MRKLNKPIIHLRQAIDYTVSALKEEKYNIELISEAPKWLKLLSRGGYCAYRNVIYVPAMHLQLVSSKSNNDRTVATAKLLSWIMLIKDNNENVSFWTSVKSLLKLNYQLHYFVYELLFLTSVKHPAKDPIVLGFMISRKNWMFKRLSLEVVSNYIKDIMTVV